jgi:hypothetical protein
MTFRATLTVLILPPASFACAHLIAEIEEGFDASTYFDESSIS